MSDHNPLAGDNNDAAEALNNAIEALTLAIKTTQVKIGANETPETPSNFTLGELIGLNKLLNCIKGTCEAAYSYHLAQMRELEAAVKRTEA